MSAGVHAPSAIENVTFFIQREARVALDELARLRSLSFDLLFSCCLIVS